jgi:excinuclease ABC subunit C
MISPKNLIDLPHSPGCYLFLDRTKKVIYVGKAKELRKRVSNYFNKNEHDSKTTLLIADIKYIDFIVTRTEIEALILENSLIKRYYPKYNIDMKDAQKYAYLHITDSELPWLEVERNRDNTGEFYGPFVSGAIRKQIYDILTRNFRLLSKKPSPKMKKLINKEDYAKRVEKARQILKGNSEKLISDLKKEMNEASSKKYYEYALTLRNQIEALKSFKEKQLIEFTKSVDSHIINYVVSGSEVYLLVFSIRKGVLEGKQEYIFSYNEDFLSEFLLRYYDSSPIPQEIILPDMVDPTLQDYLSKKRKSKVSIIVPSIGDKKQLLDLVLKNIHASFFGSMEKLIELKDVLSLPKIPIIMECFDISHLSGTNTVASMVSFNQGVPDKSNYRRFKVIAQTGGDDIAALKEVIERRYSAVKRENITRPDLIIIDGGIAQLNIAIKVLSSLFMNIPIISLAKQFEEVYIAGNKNNPIRLPHTSKALQLLQTIRDEAHRFAISYQKILRRKELLGK